MVRGVWFTTAEIGTKKKSIICCNCQTWVFEISQEHSPPSDPPPPAFGTLLRSTGNVGGGKILCVTLYDSCSAQYLVLRSTYVLVPQLLRTRPDKGTRASVAAGLFPRLTTSWCQGARVPGCLGACPAAPSPKSFLSCGSRPVQPPPADLTGPSEVTVQLHIAESSVKPRHQTVADRGLPGLPGHSVTVGMSHLYHLLHSLAVQMLLQACMQP